MASETIWLEDGEMLFAAGEPATHLFIVCSGGLDLVCRRSDGTRAVVETLIQGDLAGVSAMIHHGRRRMTAIARGACELIAIDARLLRQCCDDNPWLGRSLLMSVVDTMDRRSAAHLRMMGNED